MEGVPPGFIPLLVGQRHLCIDRPLAAPGRGCALECRSVFERLDGAAIELVQLDRRALRWWPLGLGESSYSCLTGERPLGVASPFELVVGALRLRPGVNRDLAPSLGIWGAQRDAKLDRPPLGQDQRSLEDQLLDPSGARPRSGLQGDLEEGRCRKQRRSTEGVVRQPGVGGKGDTAAEQKAFSSWIVDRGAEQRMLQRRQTE